MTYSKDPDSATGHELLKLDSRGRIQISPERRSALLDEFDRSGMTGAGFAKHYGIKYTTFAHWIRMRKRTAVRRQPRGDSGSSEKFLLVTNERNLAGVGLTIDLPHGAKVSISNAEQAKLVGTLIRAIGTGN